MFGEEWVQRWWAGDAGLTGGLASMALLPAELAFRLAVHVRDLAYARSWLAAVRAPIPVLSVGNLSLGGTGKTPVSAWLARKLRDRGVRVALAVGGYARDEILLHQRWNPDVRVHVARRRADGVAAAARDGAELAILDDGFQHRRLWRDADVVLIAAEAPPGSRLLPRGPLREPSAALRRADLLVVTRRAVDVSQAEAVATRLRAIAPDVPVTLVALRPSGWRLLDGSPASGPSGDVMTLAAVARPDLVAAAVERSIGRRVELLRFPDHHKYTLADAAAIRRRAGSRTIVTTEKDAVKLAPFADVLGDTRVLALEVAPERGGEHLESWLEMLFSLARERTRPVSDPTRT
ncbi:MAG: tetraacyldisaccharide 4'-kinase [Gemmatimonadetes bacterium]|nr:tetraacyldisaccharide 4'-kinase [Gemmatimonadota bacterium]